eukprot:CAMPEP_0115079728 /NCGR_PEP_ID=MMETSP0227-20121206/18273_1 /TAXON_ID=89957 /ORGANISM="Polarella glacialis, Strain CCMP 1383" /LENGTH=238 /DNA_ID=CAMNT_0002467271 /DNA_START=116 /DNA_END=832 /DNA_ORIENTATION=-
MDSFEDQDSFQASGQAAGQGEEEAFVHEDVDRLIRRWRNEKYAPEILPFDKDVIQNMSELLEFVAETLDGERNEGEGQDPHDPDFCLRNIDLERMRYVLRDYLRIRLWKLTRWPQHYLEPKNQDLLSAAERAFLSEYWDNKRLFLDNRLLTTIPPSKRALNEKLDFLDMVRRPEIEKHVYARIKKDVGEIEVPPSMTQSTEGTPAPLVLVEGDTYLLRYSIIRSLMMQPEHDGKVDLV